MTNFDFNERSLLTLHNYPNSISKTPMGDINHSRPQPAFIDNLKRKLTKSNAVEKVPPRAKANSKKIKYTSKFDKVNLTNAQFGIINELITLMFSYYQCIENIASLIEHRKPVKAAKTSSEIYKNIVTVATDLIIYELTAKDQMKSLIFKNL